MDNDWLINQLPVVRTIEDLNIGDIVFIYKQAGAYEQKLCPFILLHIKKDLVIDYDLCYLFDPFPGEKEEHMTSYRRWWIVDRINRGFPI